MSESSSSQNTSGQELCPSNSSCYSDPSETHIGSAPSSRGIFHLRLDSGISSLLPSDSCKYLSRHKVEQYGIQGSQLRCPTVREGPSEEEHLFRQLECNLPPRKRVLEKNGKHGYKKTGKTVSCRILNMSKNHLTSFKQLPRIPQIQHLFLAKNHIETLTGLSSLRCTPLESLILKRNPCEFHQNYRKRVFSCLPNLKMLDGILKLQEDCSSPETNIFSKICVVS
ncbi:uncharacterized protein LOC103788723 isoform X1 [Callithrix jacchus]|uniref:uncharacterized protein LOC103788723 isoform X1 n=1 Tax=Callithrix jacchus TaxID=9483 RepID=UPI0004F09009|nr:uncharacterized protein LOC103788723 isoform X1 [Callithrix jacchus]